MAAHRVILPVRGAASRPYVDTPFDANPLARIVNVLPHGQDDERLQITTRPALVKSSTRLDTAPVQELLEANRGSVVTGYITGDCTDMGTGTSREATALAGSGANAFLLDSNLAVIDDSTVSVVGGEDCILCAISPDGSRAVFGVFVPTPSPGYTRLVCINTSTYATVWTKDVGGVTSFLGRNICCTASHCLLAVRDRVLVLSMTDGTTLSTQTCNGWAQEVVAVDVWTDTGGTTYAIAAFNGSNTAAVLGSGVVVDAGNPASHFRAGVMKFTLSSAGVLTQATFGAGITSGTYFESDHRYARVSELSVLAPYGCQITDACFNPSGEVMIARTNAGYGPNASFPPDAQANGPITVMKLSVAGLRLWEADTDSIINETGLGGVFNDCPDGTPGDEPSIHAIACDAAADIYVAGRRTPAGYSAFKLRWEDGVVVWASTLMPSGGPPYSTVKPRAVAVDPADGHPVFAGTRNNAWTGSGGAQAHLWKLNASNGSVVRSADLGVAADAWCVAVGPNGVIAYGTDPV